MMMRIVLQKVSTWFDDDVDPEVRERTSKDGHGELLPVKVYNNIIPELFVPIAPFPVPRVLGMLFSLIRCSMN